MENRSNVSISGSGKIAGGFYNEVRISGSGRFEGDVNANNIHISGSAHAYGIEADSVTVSGSLHAEGDINAREVRVSGSMHADGDALGEEMKISGGAHIGRCAKLKKLSVSGSMRVGGALHADEISVSGSLATGEGVEGEHVRIGGIAKIEGLLNADVIEITLNGHSKIGEIGCDKIIVSQNKNALQSAFLHLFHRLTGRRALLEAKSIEATEIYLEDTACEVVRGKAVIIAAGCEIGRVEYEDTLSVDDGAVVGETVKL